MKEKSSLYLYTLSTGINTKAYVDLLSMNEGCKTQPCAINCVTALSAFSIPRRTAIHPAVLGSKFKLNNMSLKLLNSRVKTHTRPHTYTYN